jgi:hypothetical protein
MTAVLVVVTLEKRRKDKNRAAERDPSGPISTIVFFYVVGPFFCCSTLKRASLHNNDSIAK